MRALLISSGVLILALTALRAVLGRQVPARVTYALWGLVLLRLLLPFELPQSRVSVMNYVPQPTARVQAAQPAPQEETGQTPAADGPQQPAQALPSAGEAQAAEQTELRPWLRRVWLGGAVVLGVWMLAQNLRFARRLRRSRTRLEIPACPLPVYECPWLPSPCLFGVVRPAVYLNPAASRDPQARGWALRHELQHWRHGDPVWCLLRCVCLAVYWFDPLVWLAAVLSHRDCELACDEGVTAKLPPRQRLAYGQCLLALTPVQKAPGLRGIAAAGLSESARELQARLAAIVKNYRPAVWAVVLTLAAALCLAAATLTGASPAAQGEEASSALSQAQSDASATEGQQTAIGRDADAALEALKAGIRVNEAGELGFTVPQTGFDGPEWFIAVYGTVRMGDGAAMSVHYLEQQQAEHAWQPGQWVAIGPAQELWLYELWLSAELPSEGTDEPYLTVDLLPYVAAAQEQQNAQAAQQLAGLLPAGETLYARYTLADGSTVLYSSRGAPSAGAEPFTGGVYWAGPDGRAETLFANEYGDGCTVWEPVDVGGRVLFGCEVQLATTVQTHLWTLQNGRALAVDVPGETLAYLGGGQFAVTSSAWDAVGMVENGRMQPAGGHTSKQYWLYWDEATVSLREYGGVPITEQQLLALELSQAEAQNLPADLAMIRADGGAVDSIYLRGNGVVNINYHFDQREKDGTLTGAEYHNITLVWTEGEGYNAVNYQPWSSNWLQTLDQGGIYQAAAFPQIADDPA